MLILLSFSSISFFRNMLYLCRIGVGFNRIIPLFHQNGFMGDTLVVCVCGSQANLRMMGKPFLGMLGSLVSGPLSKHF